MAEKEPNNALNDELLIAELLSAYVDGELSGEQLAQVEQRLRTDSAAQQLVDELRSLSTTLQAMPRESVGENLSESVLQRAERLKLSETVSTTGGSRRWVWAAMALAAALLLMFVQPEADRDEQPLAVVNKNGPGDSRPQPELHAAADSPAEVQEEAVAEEAVFARSLPAEAEAATDGVVVEGLELTNRGSSQMSEPIQEVHLVLAEGRAEFDKLLASHEVVRVAGLLNQPNKLERRRAKSATARVLSEEGAEQAGEASPVEEPLVEEVLVEGSKEQLAKLLLVFQAHKSRSGSAFFDAVSDEDVSGDGVVGGALLLRTDGSRLLKGDTAGEQFANKQSLVADLAVENEEGEKLPASVKEKATERIRVLFVLHPAPRQVKPAAPTKKVRSDEKVGGKAG